MVGGGGDDPLYFVGRWVFMFSSFNYPITPVTRVVLKLYLVLWFQTCVLYNVHPGFILMNAISKCSVVCLCAHYYLGILLHVYR